MPPQSVKKQKEETYYTVESNPNQQGEYKLIWRTGNKYTVEVFASWGEALLRAIQPN
jgi:hypothetical protein